MIHVLVVDDEVPIRQWLEFCINKIKGCQVAGVASNGAEGYSIYRRTRPDIIITDIRMPVMDGLEMLKMVRNLNPEVYTAVLTSHEDFEYARQAIKLGASEYILKTEITEESLSQILENGRKALRADTTDGREKQFEDISYRNHFLRSLVLSRKEAQISEEMLRQYNIPLEKGAYVALDIMTEEEGPFRGELPKGDVLEHVFRVPLELNHTVVLGNLGRGTLPSGRRQQENLQEYCRSILKQIPYRIGCSDIYDNLCRLGEAMCQAHNRVQLSFYHPKEHMFCSQRNGTSRLTNGERYKIRFSKELINHNYSRAARIRDEMMAEARSAEIADAGYVKKMYLSFLTSLYHITRDDVEKIEEQLAALSREMMAASSLDELDAIMERGYMTGGSHAFGSKPLSAAIRNAVLYLEAHFAEPLTLPDAAAHVGLSAEYLSRLFKEETGVKFVVYLNNLRLKHALVLLESTNLKVYEVAEQVGYSNLSYFSTVFKKNFGQNPFDYKSGK